MTERKKRPRDFAQRAKMILNIATGLGSSTARDAADRLHSPNLRIARAGVPGLDVAQHDRCRFLRVPPQIDQLGQRRAALAHGRQSRERAPSITSEGDVYSFQLQSR